MKKARGFLHGAGWPPMFPKPDEDVMEWPFHETENGNLLVSQFLAIEGQAFVLVATQVLSKGNLEKLKLVGSKICQAPSGGFSMILGPDGIPLVNVLPSGEEDILRADVDLPDIDYAKAMIDTVGHYSRPDLLSLTVTPKAATVMTKMDS